ncbi:penicillin-binding protein [Campylobacterota bacterium]|nr:penicillin-binding protein [Campylobacterota bacterium]
MRLKLIIILMVIAWVVLMGRLFYLTISRGEHYGILALRNTIREESLLPVRGTIYDRSGFPLAVNRLGFSISIAPHLNRTSGKQLDEVIEFLLSATMLNGETNETLRARYIKADNPYNHDAIELVPFVPYESALQYFTRLKLNKMITISPTTLRHYPNGNIASHVLGYVAKVDRKNEKIDAGSRKIGYYGRDGLEVFYNKELQGELGVRKYQVTALNREIDEISRTEPSQNQDMALFLDIRLQRFVHEVFTREDKSGAAIVMDLENGGILAAGSYPEYDNEKFITGISLDEWQDMINDFRHPFVNKLVNSLYPPGSIIKPSVAMSFLEGGEVTPQTTFMCDGLIAVGDRIYRCWRPYGHGEISMRRALMESCDVYFYRGALVTGIDRISNKLLQHGFGAKTGVDLPNEFVGTVPSRERKMERYRAGWLHGDTVNTAIGQGDFLITPMQALVNVAMVATGRLIKPRFVQFVNNSETEFFAQNALSDSDKRHIELIRGGMHDGANLPHGTSARAMALMPFKVGGKTGTAQVSGIPQDEKKRMNESQLEFNMRSHAWFIGFAPYEKPRYAFVVLVEHGMSGGGVAAPVAAQIMLKMTELDYFGAEAKNKLLDRQLSTTKP